MADVAGRSWVLAGEKIAIDNDLGLNGAQPSK